MRGQEQIKMPGGKTSLKLDQVTKFGEQRSNVRTYMDEEFVTGDTIITDKTTRDGMALLKYWVKKVSVNQSDMKEHVKGYIHVT